MANAERTVRHDLHRKPTFRTGDVVVIAAIIAAEAAFRVLLLGGLALRYLRRAHRLSTAVLTVVPLVDLEGGL